MRHLFFLVTFILLFHQMSSAQSPYLGDNKIESKATLQLVSHLLNKYEKDHFDRDLVSSILVNKDTITYLVSTEVEVEYKYVFSENECISINIKFSSLIYLRKDFRKWLFRGKWRVDTAGHLVSRKYSARATIKRAVDCPYLFEVNLIKLDSPVSKKAFREMEKVKKKRIGTRRYLLKE